MRYTAEIISAIDHKNTATIVVDTDGYLTAMQEAHKMCKLNFPNSYVGQVYKEK